MKELVAYIAQGLVQGDGKPVVTEVEGDQVKIIELMVPPHLLGRIIGRQGRTAKALRTVVNAAAMKSAKKVLLEIVCDKDGEHA